MRETRAKTTVRRLPGTVNDADSLVTRRKAEMQQLGDGFMQERRICVDSSCILAVMLVVVTAGEVDAAESRLRGMWIEPAAISMVASDASSQTLERCTRESVQAMKSVGVTTLILAYAEYNGTFFYPSAIEFFDQDIRRIVKGADCPFDVYGTILTEADRLGMQVFLGLGRGGDTPLLWDFDKPGWHERNEKAIALGKRIASDLATEFGRHPSFGGWYLTHEMNDLSRASVYYDPLAEFCHSLSPRKPVLVAPAGTPIITKESLMKSKVDIFAYQDAVGAGYVPYKNTYDPDKRIAMLGKTYAQYARWHAETGKRIWSDLEVWEMNGKQGYSGAYPAAFERVKRQIEIEAPHVEMLTGYAWHGYLQSPNASAERPIPKARELFEAYRKRIDR